MFKNLLKGAEGKKKKIQVYKDPKQKLSSSLAKQVSAGLATFTSSSPSPLSVK